MPLVSSSIANLVNGVSQQPYTLRLSSQAELQENAISTVAKGLKKRPPTNHIKKLSGPVTAAYVHTINRDTIERYAVVVTDGDLKVYDTEGNLKVVNFPNGKTYLSTANPNLDFRIVTVADYSFVLNKSVIVQPSVSSSAVRPFEAILVVKNGLYGKTYTVNLDASTVWFTTPNGTTAADAPQIATDFIATKLTDSINAGGTGVVATRYGSTIYLTRPTDFTVSTSDGYSDAAMYAVKNRLQRFTDLPNNAGVQDFTVEIVGDKTSSFDNYFVRFDKASGTGVWRETIKPGTNRGVLSTTMPWGLVRNADGSFTFDVLPWKTRVVGDDVSAPQPSFVGRKIADVFFYRNRLGMLADESVCLSEAGEFFNFHPTTVTDLLDSDRIDVAVSHSKVSNLLAAVPFSKQLLLFSAQTQFTVESGDLLTPRTISIKPTTEFECNPLAEPQGIGRVVYFAAPRGNYSAIREYYIDENSGTNDAAEVTSHVPNYLPADIYKLVVGLNEDILCVLSSRERNTIYVYKFYWNNNEKLQSSWSKWTFPATDQILNADFLQSELNIVINRPDGLYLETLDVVADDPEDGEPFLVHLDRKQYIPKASMSFVSPYTLLPIGWSPVDGDYVAVGAANQGNKTGVVLPVIWDGTNAKVLGNLTGADLVVGRKYTYRYKFSTLVPKTKQPQGGEKADNMAILQLRNMQVNYADTGFFQAKVTPKGRPTYTYVFTGKKLGLSSATIGTVNLETGLFKFPVLSQNISVDIELDSDSPLPCSFLSADWEGFYAKRSQGI